MRHSLTAVLWGTFTLRFSTGLTGAMLLYYLAQLPEFGGAAVSSSIAGVMTAVYFATELVLSPVFGVLSDRFGAQRIMPIGPILGAVAVLITAATTNLWLLGGTVAPRARKCSAGSPGRPARMYGGSAASGRSAAVGGPGPPRRARCFTGPAPDAE